jgi:hypothetical protein
MEINLENELQKSLSDLLDMFLDLAENKDSIVQKSVGAGMERVAALEELDGVLERILGQILLTRKEIALNQKTLRE